MGHLHKGLEVFEFNYHLTSAVRPAASFGYGGGYLCSCSHVCITRSIGVSMRIPPDEMIWRTVGRPEKDMLMAELDELEEQ